LTGDEERLAAEMMSGVSGRRITRVLLDFAVSLEVWELGLPTVEFKLEQPFELLRPGVQPLRVNPERLGRAAEDVATLFGAEIVSVAVGAGGVLRLALNDGRSIQAASDDQYESWSYSSDDGGKVFCLASGQLSIFGPIAAPRTFPNAE
jgi:hypothetical protein